MDDYEVRSRYAYDDAYGGGTDYAKAAEFDAWLAEHDRAVAANAWDECKKSSRKKLRAVWPQWKFPADQIKKIPNPYRITEEDN